MLCLFYIIFSFLILRFSVTMFNFISNPKLTASPKHYDDLVSILIPVRNEEENIINLLESIESQDYKNIEIILLDDSSTDKTFSVCEEFCAKHSRFAIIRGSELQPGWMGKTLLVTNWLKRLTVNI